MEPTGQLSRVNGGRPGAPTATARGLRPLPAVVGAVAAVAGATALGQRLAGPDPRARLAEIDTTRLALPFGVWLVVAGIYYVLAGTVVYRLGRRLPAAHTAFIAVLCMMAANEAWNGLLFGLDSLGAAAVAMVAFAAGAVATAIAAWRADRTAGTLLTPYVAWLALYDVPWIIVTWLSRGQARV